MANKLQIWDNVQHADQFVKLANDYVLQRKVDFVFDN